MHCLELPTIGDMFPKLRCSRQLRDNNTALNCRAYNDVYGVVYTSGIKNGEINKFAGTDYYYHVNRIHWMSGHFLLAERGLNANHAGLLLFYRQMIKQRPRGQLVCGEVSRKQNHNVPIEEHWRSSITSRVVTQCTFTGLISDSTRDSNELN